jgi:hypothetical protein
MCLKMLNRQSEIRTATDFAFESEVFLHNGFLHGECGGSVSPRTVAMPLLPAKARSSGLPEVYFAALSAAQR